MLAGTPIPDKEMPMKIPITITIDTDTYYESDDPGDFAKVECEGASEEALSYIQWATQEYTMTCGIERIIRELEKE